MDLIQERLMIAMYDGLGEHGNISFMAFTFHGKDRQNWFAAD